jgi:hypothetical protein
MSRVQDGCAGVHAMDDRPGTCQRLPETTLCVTSRRPTPDTRQRLSHLRGCVARELPHGVVNHPHIDGKDGVAGSIPTGMHTAVWAGSPSSEGARPMYGATIGI